MWARSGLIFEAVDQTMLTPSEGLLVKQLGVSRTLDAIQRLVGCSAILAWVAEAEFGPMASQLAQVDEEIQVWNRTRAEYDGQLDSLKRTDALVAEVQSVKHSIQVGQEKLSSLESDVAALQAKVASQDDLMKAKDATILQRGMAMVRQYEYGFNHALAQARILHPDLDLSRTDPYKEIVDGQIVDVPSP
ncbi:hypothetical protein CR513_17249, partial [Mucuna pruriens]